jgi:hypothetical protein
MITLVAPPVPSPMAGEKKFTLAMALSNFNVRVPDPVKAIAPVFVHEVVLVAFPGIARVST